MKTPLLAQQPTSSRIEWIETLKGITVLLVVMHHATLASQSWFLAGGVSTLPEGLLQFDKIMSNFRMPAFFLCSGLVFASTMQKGTRWFIEKRILGASWIILVWTIAYYVYEISVIPLIPWNSEFLQTSQAIWAPAGHLWFMYALIICSLTSFIVQGLSCRNKILISLLLSLLATYLGSVAHAPIGIVVTLDGLGASGFFFFMTGAALGNTGVRMVENPRTLLMMSTLSVALIALYIAFGNKTWLQDLVGIRTPSTLIFVSFIFLASTNSVIFSRVFSSIGSISLRIFLVHQIPISLGLMLLMVFFSFDNPISFWLILVITGIVGSLILQKITYVLSGGLAYTPPNWLKFPTLKNVRCAH